jgi:hypothetical protein
MRASGCRTVQDLKAVYTRWNLSVRSYCEVWKEYFEEKRLLKQLMTMHKIPGSTMDLDEESLEQELRKIMKEPNSGVEADSPLLFMGIQMDMKDGDVLSRVCKFLADCNQRIVS